MEQRHVAGVVDGDEAERLAICSCLEQIGLETLPFASLDAAMAGLGSGRQLDVAVVSLNLPGMDGWRFCRLLRSSLHSRPEPVPVVLVAALHAGESAAQITADLGAEELIRTPIDADRLAGSVRRALLSASGSGAPTVLIVEDDQLFAQLLAEVLQDEGYVVQTCDTAAEAVRLADTCAYDLALVDYHLPDAKGDQVLDALVAGAGTCDCLMMTGDPDPKLSLEWVARGAAGYLKKPFDPGYLVQTCARVRRHRELTVGEGVLRNRMAELMVTNERHRRLANAAMEGIWVLDGDFRTTYVNAALASMLGYSIQELLGSSFEDFLFPEDLADHQRCIARRREGEEEVYERRFRRRDGSVLWTLLSAKPIQGPEGGFGGSFAMLTDIGERKRIEAVLESRLRLLQLVEEHSLDDLLRATLDEAERLTESRVGFYHFFDEERQSVSLQMWSTSTTARFCGADPGKQHYALAHAGVWVDAVRERRPVIHNDYPSLPHRKGLPEGHAPIVRELVVPVMRGGRIVALLGIGNKETPYTDEDIQSVASLADLAWDIAESKRRAEVLRESEANFRAFFDSMGDLIIVTDRDGRILATNSALRSRLGYGDDSVSAANLVDLCPEGEQARVGAILETAFKEGANAASLPLRTRAGELIPLETNCWLGTWDGLECLFLSSHDLTAEQEIRRSFARVFESNPLPMALNRLSDASFLDVNAAFLEATGLDREEILGRTVLELGLFPDEESFRRALGELVETGQLHDCELLLSRRDGQTRSGRFFGEVIRLGGEDVLLSLMVDIGERKEWEDALRRSEERLQSIFRVAPTGIGVVQDRRLVEVNDQVCAMTGYTQEELIGQSSRILYPTQEDFEHVGKEKYAQIAAKGTGTLQTRWQRKDGTVIDVLLSSTPMQVGSLSLGVTFTALDITERRRMEEKLRISRHYLRTFLDATPDLCFLKDQDLRYLFVNKANAEYFGLSVDEVVGQADEQLMPAAAARGCAMSDRQAIAERRPVVSVEVVGEREYETRKVPVVLGDEGIGVAGIIRDITQSRQDERELRQFKTIFDTAHFGVAIATLGGRFTYVNESFAASHGYSVAEVLDLPLLALHSESQRRDVEAHIASVIAGDSGHPREIGHMRRDGSEFPMLMVAMLVHDGDGKPTCIACTAIDITETKQLQAQLNRTQRMDSIGRLVGGVAHDFNNMLCGILGHAECALEGVDPSGPVAADLRDICEATERSASLTRQLLVFARKQPAAPKVLDLNKTVSGMFRMLERIVGEDIEFRWEPGACPKVKMDPSQIDQILVNLCVNARDAIVGSGTIVIRTRAEHHDGTICGQCSSRFSGDYVCLEVADTGCGMDEATMEHLFEPFFTTKEEGKGTGLGLATVYGIVKQNSGHLKVTSKLGSGTTFQIRLPAHVVAPEEEGQRSPRRAMPRGGDETILVVEDEPSILSVSAGALSRLGYRVLSANGSQEAIETMVAHGAEIDLVVTDVVMPQMNGPQLIEQLTTMRPGLRCLYMSGYAGDALAERGIHGVDINFIQKPFSMRDLGEKVRHVLDSEAPDAKLDEDG